MRHPYAPRAIAPTYTPTHARPQRAQALAVLAFAAVLACGLLCGGAIVYMHTLQSIAHVFASIH